MSETRKLAAILVADVVGFSRLAGAEQERTLARLRVLRGDLIDPAVAAHYGRVVKSTGDGALIEFRSVVDAVRCAIEVQTGMVERNAGVPQKKRIELRIGVHLGDVVEEDDGDLMGAGVNIAARLEGIAKPGAICLSEDAYRQVKGRIEMKVGDLGAVKLKNIADPMHVYLVKGGPLKQRSALSYRLVAGLAILAVAGAAAWYGIAGKVSTTAESSTTAAASSFEPTAPTASSVQPTTPTDFSVESTLTVLPDADNPPMPPERAETPRQLKSASDIKPDDAEFEAKRVVRSWARRLPSKARLAQSHSTESASNSSPPCILSVAEMNGNHPSCEYLHGLPQKAEPAKSPPVESASNSSPPCILSVAEVNGNHPGCQYLHGLPQKTEPAK